MTSYIKFRNSDSFQLIALHDIFLFIYICTEEFPILPFTITLICLAKLVYDI